MSRRVKRVAMIAPHFEEYALHLANALARSVPVQLYVDRRPLDRDFNGRAMPIEGRLTLIDVDYTRPVSVVRVLLGLIAFRPSVLHIQEPSGFAKAILATIMSTLFRPFCTVALTVHDPEPHVGRDSKIVARFAAMRRYVRRHAELVFVHGDFCRSIYQARYARAGQAVRLTDHGVILGGVGPSPEGGDALRMLAFGRMEEYKGLDVLCATVEQMHAEGVAFKLTVAGHGPELDRLESRLRALPEVAIVNAFVPSIDLIAMIRASDCVVLPYLEATQSGVLAAAYANERFVVASNVGGLPDIVVDGDNGLLVEPGDPVALAGVLTRAVGDAALRARLAQGAARTATHRMDWNRIAARLLSDYETLGSQSATTIQAAVGAPPGPADRPTVTIGIKALNEQVHIAESLASAVAAVGPFGGEVVLADSGSTDRTIEIASAFPVAIVQLADPSERSCGAGAQLAFQHARGAYFYLLDGDMVLAPGFIEAGIAFLEAHPAVAAVGGLVTERNTTAEEFEIRESAVNSLANWRPGIVDRLDCGGLYRMSALRELGYFADRNLHAFEEFEVASRLRARGWQLARIDHPAIDHYGHLMGGYRLLWRRLASGYAGAAGEVLRAALGRSHLSIVLGRLTHVRNGFIVVLWWLAVIASLVGHFPLTASLALLFVPLLFLIVRRRSIRLGIYSVMAWNVIALGLLTGLARRRVPPERPLRSVTLKDFVPEGR